MGAQAPQWLLTSFVDAMQQIGATAAETDLEHEGADLMQRWNAPNRQLHNLRRLMNTLTHIDEIASSAHDPDILRVAAWYHGAFLNKALRSSSAAFRRTSPRPDVSSTHIVASPASVSLTRSWRASTNSSPS